MKKKLEKLYRNGGFWAVSRKLFEVLNRVFSEKRKSLYFKFTPSGTFKFKGEELKYFRHAFNLAYQNERTVEIAIAKWFLSQQKQPVRILEVGNVLRNYGVKFRGDVLDKYDLSPGIINQDVISFCPKEKYQAIISISTLEHVGWDEPDRDPGKIPAAIINLRDNCLLPGGSMLVSLPLGYNQYFDEYLKNGGEVFSEKYFLKRVSAENEWSQVQYKEIVGSKFGEPYNNANVMFIGVVGN